MEDPDFLETAHLTLDRSLKLLRGSDCGTEAVDSRQSLHSTVADSSLFSWNCMKRGAFSVEGFRSFNYFSSHETSV